jgi:peptidyl-prolyl cis-trans isomerase SurA
MKKLFACLLLAAGIAGAAETFAQAPDAGMQPVDRIAAIVDEDVVLRSELDRAVANVRSQYAGRQVQLPPADVLERQVLERLVLMKLQLARAEQTGVRVTDQEVDNAIAGIAQQNQLSMEQLRAQIARDGTAYEDFRASIREELIIQRLRQRFAQTRVSVSEAEIDSALTAQQGAGQQFRLAHILVGVPEGATPEQIATAKSKIEGVLDLINRGEMDFAAAAVRYSDSPNALEGGDLGWRSIDEIPPAFGQLISQMQPGQVSEPIRGASGYQLVQLVEVRSGEQPGAQMVTQVHARHILIRTQNPVADAAARAKIDTIAARLAGGASFEELARAESQDLNSKAKGGDLGWVVPETYGLQFGGQLSALSDGQISAPFSTDVGWHIVQRLDTRQADAGEQNRRTQISDVIGRRKLEDEWNRYLREIRGEAYVVDMRNGIPAELQGQPQPAEGEAPADGTTPPQG